jgi:CBS domain-containing protein
MPEDLYILFNFFPTSAMPSAVLFLRIGISVRSSTKGWRVLVVQELLPSGNVRTTASALWKRGKKEGEYDMKARDVMNKRVTAATPRAIGRDLALQLLSGMYSGLPVVDAKGAVVGVVTEFDLLNAVRAGKDLQTVKAQEIMGQPPVCVEEDESLESVIAKMTTHHIIRVPVVRDGKLVGVIARADILSRLIEPEFVTVFGGQ